MTADLRDTNNKDVEQSPKGGEPSPGEQLRHARLRAGLSERDVATSLRLLPEQITALENNDFERFNGPLFCKAHLRACANLLQLDGDELVDLYLASLPEDARAPEEKPLFVPPIQRPRRGRSFQYWSAVALVVVSGGLWLNNAEQVGGEATLLPSVEIDGNDQSSLRVLEGRGQQAPQQLEGTKRVADIDFDEAGQTAVVIDLPASEAASSATAPVASAGDDVLSFEFSEDCWVEVTDGRGETIYASLKHAKEALELTGQGPFKVLLGYAHGVNLDYNGEPVEINVENRNNSARFVVGNLPVQ